MSEKKIERKASESRESAKPTKTLKSFYFPGVGNGVTIKAESISEAQEMLAARSNAATETEEPTQS